MLKPLVVIAILIVLVLLTSEVLVGWLSFTRLVTTKGNLFNPPNITIYEDINCTRPVYQVDWGSLQPGMTSDTTMYIRNIGEREVELALNATNWRPANISNYLNLTWSYNGASLFPSETVKVTLTLSSSSSPDFTEYLVAYDVRDFTFDIIISAFS